MRGHVKECVMKTINYQKQQWSLHLWQLHYSNNLSKKGKVRVIGVAEEGGAVLSYFLRFSAIFGVVGCTK